MHCHILAGSPLRARAGFTGLIVVGQTNGAHLAAEVASAGLNLPGSGQAGISGSVYLLYGLYELEATGRSGALGIVSSFLAENTAHELKTSVSAVPAEMDARTR